MQGNRKLEGARAFNKGVERDRCPHAPGTDAFKDWMVGWKQQNAEFQTRLQLEHVAMRFAKAS